jgi:hypothetical protein
MVCADLDGDGDKDLACFLLVDDLQKPDSIMIWRNLLNERSDTSYLEEKKTKSFLTLYQNYPNPFNSKTIIRYFLRRDSEVNVTIYNILGQKVKNLVNCYQLSGHKSVIWDGTNQKGKGVASGVYFYRIRAGNFVQYKKMLLLK